ncbi:UNVERIFIED_CONTAM: hypothetical protein FKN15_057835 [Acipenser sinensis]
MDPDPGFKCFEMLFKASRCEDFSLETFTEEFYSVLGCMLLAEEHKDVVFLKVDVDEAQDVAEMCNVSSMPTFQFFKNGQKVCHVTSPFKTADVSYTPSLLNWC